MIVIKSYRPKTQKVGAIQVTEENHEEVMDWCMGYYPHQMHWPQPQEGREPLFMVKVVAGYMWVYEGFYVIRDAGGEFTVKRPEEFERRYDPTW